MVDKAGEIKMPTQKFFAPGTQVWFVYYDRFNESKCKECGNSVNSPQFVVSYGDVYKVSIMKSGIRYNIIDRLEVTTSPDEYISDSLVFDNEPAALSMQEKMNEIGEFQKKNDH